MISALSGTISRHKNKIVKITLKFRLRDKHAAELNRQAHAVNFVWNYCNETQQKAVAYQRRWLSGYDLWKLVAGCAKQGLDLQAHSAMRVCMQYDKSRRQHKKRWLRWRGKKSLGWVPFNTDAVKFRGGAFVFRKTRYETMHLREMKDGIKIGAGSFNQDSRGRRYLNCPVDIAEANSAPNARV